MYSEKQIEKTLFLDIETVSQYKSYDELKPGWKRLWDKKHTAVSRNIEPAPSPSETYESRAAIFSEFGKIICISVGYLRKVDGNSYEIRFKSFQGDDEHALLVEFNELINSHFGDPKVNFFCGHNIREFDIPYVCRRMLIHEIPIPHILDVRGKKPWDVAYFIDTLELWRFGDRKSYSSLDLLTQTLDVPTPKEGIDGSQVGHFYYELNDLEGIVKYCERDVLAVARVLLKMCHMKQSILESKSTND